MPDDIFDTRFENVDVEVPQNMVGLGDDINLNHKDAAINDIIVGVGWDLNEYQGDPVDLDVSVFLLGANDMTRKDEDFVFYNQMESDDRAVTHKGDSRTGAGDGDDEVVAVSLNNVPFDVSRLAFVLSIYDAEQKSQDLSAVKGGFLRIAHAGSGREIARYVFGDDFKDHREAGMIIAEVAREGGNWHFRPKANFFEKGLSEIAQRFGIVIAGL